MTVRLPRLTAIWVWVALYWQQGCGLRNRVYIEADKNCGHVKTIEEGEHFIVGSKHGGQEILKENCVITFKLANQRSKDRICIEFEQLDFKGNCYASLSVIDVVGEGGVGDADDGSVYSVARKEKQVGLFSCMREPPVEMCSSGQTMRIHLDRGYHMLDRELVVFLLEIYTKNPDASPTNRPFEEASAFWFFGDQPAPVILLVIIALCLVITITATTIVICMRLKSRTSETQVPIQPEYTRPNASALSQDAHISASALSTYEYYQMQPLHPNAAESRRLAPTAPYMTPTSVYGYHRLQKDATVAAQHRFCDRSNQANQMAFPTQRSVTGYMEPISDRSVSPNDAGYSTEPAPRCCYHGYRSQCVLHGYGGVASNCRVLQGYSSYPGLQYMGLPSNYGNRAGEEDADESDVSECEGQDGVSKGRSSHHEADFAASEKTDSVQWAQMGVL